MSRIDRVVYVSENEIHVFVEEINRGGDPEEVLGFGVLEIEAGALASTIPVGQGEKVEMVFFNAMLDNEDELVAEYERRGLTADPYAQAAVNKAISSFFVNWPNGAYWQEANGRRCFCAFYSFGRALNACVLVSQNFGHIIRHVRWFGGARRVA